MFQKCAREGTRNSARIMGPLWSGLVWSEPSAFQKYFLGLLSILSLCLSSLYRRHPPLFSSIAYEGFDMMIIRRYRCFRFSKRSSARTPRGSKQASKPQSYASSKLQLTHRVTVVKCRTTSVAKKCSPQKRHAGCKQSLCRRKEATEGFSLDKLAAPILLTFNSVLCNHPVREKNDKIFLI